MLTILKKIFKKLLSDSIYQKIKKILKFFICYKSRNYSVSKDLKHNEDLLNSFGFEIDKIKSKLNSLNYNYYDERLSWHYHLFIGLKEYFKDQQINILEIGTYDGTFTNFISKIYDNSKITTIDLDDNDVKFTNFYQRDTVENLNLHLEKRKININMKNINFIKLNSIDIKKYFVGNKFDLIWIDGDHLNPQVTIDIINSMDLLNKNGVICVDDIVMNFNFVKDNYVSNESFLTLSHLESNNVLKNYYFVKKIRKKNFYRKKYISLSIFQRNIFF
jgi:predicted O-methyltransferase YrrM